MKRLLGKTDLLGPSLCQYTEDWDSFDFHMWPHREVFVDIVFCRGTQCNVCLYVTLTLGFLIYTSPKERRRGAMRHVFDVVPTAVVSRVCAESRCRTEAPSDPRYAGLHRVSRRGSKDGKSPIPWPSGLPAEMVNSYSFDDSQTCAEIPVEVDTREYSSNIVIRRGSSVNFNFPVGHFAVGATISAEV